LTVTTATFLSPRVAMAFLTLMAALNLAPEGWRRTVTSGDCSTVTLLNALVPH
jgi:hypothetical protein